MKEASGRKQGRLDWTFKRLVIRMLLILIADRGIVCPNIEKAVEQYLKETD